LYDTPRFKAAVVIPYIVVMRKERGARVKPYGVGPIREQGWWFLPDYLICLQ
jgi:hypothetical protein